MMHTEVQSLIEQTLSTDECNVDEYLNDDVPTCMEAESYSWKADFFEKLGQKRQEEQEEEQQVADGRI